jgi:alpha-beta hydrolase superfamily lysophospholipase
MRVVALLTLFLLAGCVGGGISSLPSDPAHSSAATARIAQDTLIAEDGARLPLRIWMPAGPIKAAVLAVHGFNDYSNAFAGPAEEWAKAGIVTYAYDQRGFGLAPQRGQWVGTQRLAQDLTLASHLVRARHPKVPLYLLGESMGGALVITDVTGTAGAAPPVYDGIILSAPAVWARPDMNVFERIALWTAYHLMPGMTVSGRGLHIVPSDNIPMLRALSKDPLVIKETRIDAVKGLVDLMDLAQASASRLTAPLLLLYGERDPIIPATPMREMLGQLPPQTAAFRRIAWYPGGYHMLMRDLDGPTVIADVESWIANQAAPLPSGADRRGEGLLARGE